MTKQQYDQIIESMNTMHRFFKEHMKVVDNEKYWQQLIDDAKPLYTTQFQRDLIMAVMCELERVARNGQ